MSLETVPPPHRPTPDGPANAHGDLHSEQGGSGGEHPGALATPWSRCATWPGWSSRSPTWTARRPSPATSASPSPHRTDGRAAAAGHAWPAPHALVIRRGPALPLRRPGLPGRGRRADLDRLARATGSRVRDRGAVGRRRASSTWSTRAGIPVAGGARRAPSSPALPEQPPLALNFGDDADAGQRYPAAAREPSRRCSGSATSCWRHPRSAPRLDWYLETLGLIVSDFLFLPGQRERGPTMAFIRCDQGGIPTDHHTLAMAPAARAAATSTPPTRSPTSTRSRPAASTSPSAATATPGASAGTSRAARSSTTGATRTG